MMQFVSGSTRALACPDRRPRRSATGAETKPNRYVRRRSPVFREGAEHHTRGRVCSPSNCIDPVNRQTLGLDWSV